MRRLLGGEDPNAWFDSYRSVYGAESAGLAGAALQARTGTISVSHLSLTYGNHPYICQNPESMPTTDQGKARFDTRLSQEQKLFFERAATIGGFRNLTEFVIRTVQDKAEELIEQKERIIASKKDSEIFFKALIGRIKPNKNLTKAAKEYQEYLDR